MTLLLTCFRPPKDWPISLWHMRRNLCIHRAPQSMSRNCLPMVLQQQISRVLWISAKRSLTLVPCRAQPLSARQSLRPLPDSQSCGHPRGVQPSARYSTSKSSAYRGEILNVFPFADSLNSVSYSDVIVVPVGKHIEHGVPLCCSSTTNATTAGFSRVIFTSCPLAIVLAPDAITASPPPPAAPEFNIMRPPSFGQSANQ